MSSTARFCPATTRASLFNMNLRKRLNAVSAGRSNSENISVPAVSWDDVHSDINITFHVLLHVVVN